jgi:hypothetical protein
LTGATVVLAGAVILAGAARAEERFDLLAAAVGGITVDGDPGLLTAFCSTGSIVVRRSGKRAVTMLRKKKG